MKPSVLVTAFGPFDEFQKNPSELLAGELSAEEAETRTLPVSYRAVEQFLARAHRIEQQTVVMLGANKRATMLTVERRARNWVSDRPDVDRVAREAGPILAGRDAWRSSEMFQSWHGNPPYWTVSDDCGTYLCNYLYFRMLAFQRRFRVGFIHVPPVEVVPLQRQIVALRRILTRIENV
jgi:pyrrolidone-carboxylate peptidase